MRVAVTGGAGFIGSHLVDRLLADGHQVAVLDDFSTGRRTNLPEDRPNLRVLEGDVSDPRAAAAVADGCGAVVHLAAIASVQASVEAPVRTHRTNLVGTLMMLEASAAAGVQRFIYASSAAVYGDAATPVEEEAPTRPLSPYATDKLAGEHYLAYYHREGRVKGVAFRFFNVYGPRQDPSSPYSGVVSIFLRRARDGRPLTVYGDGLQTRDFVYVGDVVDTLANALEQPLGPELGVFNVGSGKATSLLELIAAVQDVAGPVEVRHEPARVGDIRDSLADVRRLRALGNGIPQTSLRTGLRATLESMG